MGTSVAGTACARGGMCILGRKEGSRSRGLSAPVHQALVTTANGPPDDLFHVIDEVPPVNLIADDLRGHAVHGRRGVHRDPP